MVIPGDGVSKLDGETIPDSFVIGYAECGFFPDLRPFAAIFGCLFATGSHAQFQRPSPCTCDRTLELDRSGFLFAIVAIVKPACGREIFTVESVEKGLAQWIGNRWDSDEECKYK
ncbi:hypothetical protein CEV33_3019 [Brucella grignonensis]|uniref:Uncharacterized protein n=1 Tax=Brucella grignonensis TaxID=94627 RepID=A0A256F2R0_9HYPH|nr:hypothetical protein CEV33_3019 [Brucella grignonensis]